MITGRTSFGRGEISNLDKDTNATLHSVEAASLGLFSDPGLDCMCWRDVSFSSKGSPHRIYLNCFDRARGGNGLTSIRIVRYSIGQYYRECRPSLLKDQELAYP